MGSDFGCIGTRVTIGTGMWQRHLSAVMNGLCGATMAVRTVVLSSYEAYLNSEYPPERRPTGDDWRSGEDDERNARLELFPYPVMLELSYPEMDFANRWCWQNIGPCDGVCNQSQSEYPACPWGEAHSHNGRWICQWFCKTDYDFGFQEWYFFDNADRLRFLDNVPHINWGEKYPVASS